MKKQFSTETRTFARVSVFENGRYEFRTIPNTKDRSVTALDLPKTAFGVQFYDRIVFDSVINDAGDQLQSEPFNSSNLTLLSASRPIEINEYFQKEIEVNVGVKAALNVVLILEDPKHPLEQVCTCYTLGGQKVGPAPFFKEKTDILKFID